MSRDWTWSGESARAGRPKRHKNGSLIRRATCCCESPAWTRSSVDDVREDGLQEQGGTVVNSLKNSSDMMLLHLPTEVLLQILGHLDVCDLLATSRTSHHLRDLSLAPILHLLRLRRTRAILPPMLTSPSRPSLSDLMRRSIFLTHTTVVSRRLARSLVAIRLSRRLAARPSAEVLVERAVLPPECLPCMMVAPGLVARKRAVERERVKDGLRRWIGSVWRGEVDKREQGVRVWEERVGVGRVWRLRRFWERVGGDV
ncbi:F-box domain-containing protein [Podospora appendiculata]|uniref:F-box domain-containing protein n=1 Tax=Podospora appendiculata TaxID=314037 RepID=A0AAE0XHA3_9PEZI|nr:F-box domain-containing protein [Podospora appendiculata]